MSRSIANVQIATDTFSGWVTKTNELLNSHTNELVTASNTAAGANTYGNVSVIGVFSANILTTPSIYGGNSGNAATLTTLTVGISNSSASSNVVLTGYTANITANNINLLSNTVLNAANIYANSAVYRAVANIALSGNSTTNNILITGNTTATAVTVNGNTSGINTTSFSVNSVSTITGNTTLKANTSVTNITVLGGTTSNVTLTGNLVTISSNLTVSANVTSITGNVTFDSNSLFIDSVNDRVGILTASPSYALHVKGSNTYTMVGVENTQDNTLFTVLSSNSITSTPSIIAKAGTNTSLVFASNNASGTSGKLIIAANGNVGIANATPDALVTIGAGTKVYSNGTVQTSGDLICSGDLYANIVFMGGTSQATVTATVCPIVPPNTTYSSAEPGPYTFLVFSNTEPQRIDVIDKAQGTGYQAVKYTIQVQDNEVANEVFMTEVSMIYGYGNAHSTQYGTIYTNSAFVEVSVGANSTYYWLQAAPTTAYLTSKGGSANLQFRGVRQKAR
jgi:hypothetical protein